MALVQPTETFGIARFLQLEKTVSHLNGSIGKLVQVSADHGERLRELYEKLYHAATKIELSSSLGHTQVTLQKFQNKLQEQVSENQETERRYLQSLINGQMLDYASKKRVDAESEATHQEMSFIKGFIADMDKKFDHLADSTRQEGELRRKVTSLELKNAELAGKILEIESKLNAVSSTGASELAASSRPREAPRVSSHRRSSVGHLLGGDNGSRTLLRGQGHGHGHGHGHGSSRAGLHHGSKANLQMQHSKASLGGLPSKSNLHGLPSKSNLHGQASKASILSQGASRAHLHERRNSTNTSHGHGHGHGHGHSPEGSKTSEREVKVLQKEIGASERAEISNHAPVPLSPVPGGDEEADSFLAISEEKAEECGTPPLKEIEDATIDAEEPKKETELIKSSSSSSSSSSDSSSSSSSSRNSGDEEEDKLETLREERVSSTATSVAKSASTTMSEEMEFEMPEGGVASGSRSRSNSYVSISDSLGSRSRSFSGCSMDLFDALREDVLTAQDDMRARLLAIEAAMGGGTHRVDDLERRNDKMHEALRLLDGEHSALLAAHKAAAQERAVSEASIFATIEHVVSIANVLQAEMGRHETQLQRLTRKVERGLVAAAATATTSKTSTDDDSDRAGQRKLDASHRQQVLNAIPEREERLLDGFATHQLTVPALTSMKDLLGGISGGLGSGVGALLDGQGGSLEFGGSSLVVSEGGAAAAEANAAIRAEDIAKLRSDVILEVQKLPAVIDTAKAAAAASVQLEALDAALRRVRAEQALILTSHSSVQQELALLRKIVRAHSLSLAKRLTKTPLPVADLGGGPSSEPSSKSARPWFKPSSAPFLNKFCAGAGGGDGGGGLPHQAQLAEQASDPRLLASAAGAAPRPSPPVKPPSRIRQAFEKRTLRGTSRAASVGTAQPASSDEAFANDELQLRRQQGTEESFLVSSSICFEQDAAL